MKPLRYTASALALGLALMANAQAVTTIPFWHSMEGELGKEVDSLAQRFNAENPDYKIVPTYKGNYEQNLSAGIAAFRTGNAPAILQVYEVGTATMMASKAIKPVYDVFKEAGIQFDESQFVPTVSGYYSDSKTGHLLSQPFNSSTPVLYYNKDAFKKAGLDPEQPPKTWQDLADYAAKLKASGMKCGYASGWQGWIQLENFSAWNGLPFASKNNGFDGTDAVLVKQGPGTPHIRLKKIFCSPNCEKSAVHRKSFRIVTGQKSPAGNQVTALCVLYAGQKGVYGLVSRGTPRCPAHPMQ